MVLSPVSKGHPESKRKGQLRCQLAHHIHELAADSVPPILWSHEEFLDVKESLAMNDEAPTHSLILAFVKYLILQRQVDVP